MLTRTFVIVLVPTIIEHKLKRTYHLENVSVPTSFHRNEKKIKSLIKMVHDHKQRWLVCDHEP